MNNTNENKTSDIYLAHVDFETGRTQSFQEHTDNVTSYAKSICPMEEIIRDMISMKRHMWSMPMNVVCLNMKMKM